MKISLETAFSVSVVSLLLFLVQMPSLAQEAQSAPNPTTVHEDTSDIQVRRPSQDWLATFRNDPAFRYDRDSGSGVTLLDRIRAWFWRLVQRLPLQGVVTLWKIVPYLLLAFTILYVVSRLLKTDIKGLFYKPSRELKLEFTEIEEEIEDGDFSALIDQAIAQKKWKRAVRFSYLRALKQLVEKGLIDWKLEKTNHDYLDELKQPGLKQRFAELTELFEYVWYGNVQLNESRFQSAAHQFTSFSRHLAEESA